MFDKHTRRIEGEVTFKAQRYLIWIGLICAFIYFLSLVVLMGLIPPMAPTLAPEAVVRVFSEHNTMFRIGGGVAMAVSGFWLAFGAVVTAQMYRHESEFPVWSLLQAMASTVGALLFALPILIWYVAAFTVTRNPEITAMLNEFAWLAFLTPIVAFTLQLLPIVVISFTSKPGDPYTAFPRWLAYLTLWMITFGDVPILAILFKTGPLAWNGLISFWIPVGIYGVWLGSLTFLLLRAIRHQESTANDVDPDPAVVSVQPRPSADIAT